MYTKSMLIVGLSLINSCYHQSSCPNMPGECLWYPTNLVAHLVQQERLSATDVNKNQNQEFRLFFSALQKQPRPTSVSRRSMTHRND